MTTVLRRPLTVGPARHHIGPADAGWKYVSFQVVPVPRGVAVGFQSADEELCVVVIDGRCEVGVGTGTEWASIGGRVSPFDGPPPAYYAPPGCVVRVRAEEGGEIAVGSAPAPGGFPDRQLPPAAARLEVRGTGVTERRIHHILMEDQPASSLLVTEVITPAGHWSSYPPHKHDTDDPPRESYLEEIYYFRFRDPHGFGLMRVYTADRSLDEAIAVRDRDLVLVPRGYHTFSAAPGYEAYYLNVMAGPRRDWRITFDPDHERMRW